MSINVGPFPRIRKHPRLLRHQLNDVLTPCSPNMLLMRQLASRQNITGIQHSAKRGLSRAPHCYVEEDEELHCFPEPLSLCLRPCAFSGKPFHFHRWGRNHHGTQIPMIKRWRSAVRNVFMLCTFYSLAATDWQAPVCIDCACTQPVWATMRFSQNKMNMLHPIIFPAIYNINVRLACKMQSGVSSRCSTKATPGCFAGAFPIECTAFNRQGTFSYLIYSGATWKLDLWKSIRWF